MFNLFPIIPDAPPPFPAVNDRNAAHWVDEGGALLKATSEALGLPPLFGAVLDAQSIRAIVHKLVTGGVSMLRSLTGLLVGGAINLGSWFKSFIADLVPRQMAAGLAALGIGGQADPALVAQVNQQAGFLARFRDQIADAERILDGTAVARAGQYARAVWGIAQNLWRGRMRMLGYLQEARILGVADHCGGCLDQAKLRWQPIGTLKPIGATECGSQCHCHFLFR